MTLDIVLRVVFSFSFIPTHSTPLPLKCYLCYHWCHKVWSQVFAIALIVIAKSRHISVSNASLHHLTAALRCYQRGSHDSPSTCLLPCLWSTMTDWCHVLVKPIINHMCFGGIFALICGPWAPSGREPSQQTRLQLCTFISCLQLQKSV